MLFRSLCKAKRHRYKHNDMADLQRASLDDVRAFHDHYYAPDNAVLSIAGDFEPAQAMELVRR